MWSYEPLSEEAAEKERQFVLLEDGTYNFEVVSAEAKQSKTGNPMIELHLKIWDKDGKDHLVYDYLVGTSNMAWKLRHFCASIGLSKEYESGTFKPFQSEQKTGIAIISWQAGKQKPDGSFYKNKNVVEDYILNMKGEIKDNVESPPNELVDSDIPF
jgi:hypothetical protein